MEPGRHRFDTASVGTIAMAHSVHDTYSAFLPPLIPTFIERLSLSRAEAGLLVAFLQGPSLLQPLFGRLGDRFDPRPVVAAAPAVTAAAMSLLGVSPAFAWTAVLLVVAGCSAAALHAVGPALAAELSGDRVGRGMGYWMVGGELGRALGPLVVVSGIRVLGLAGTPWLMAGGLAASALLLGRLRSLPWLPRSVSGTGRHGPGGLEARDLLQVMVPLAGLLVARAFLLAALASFLPLFLREEGASLWAAGSALAVVEAAGIAGALGGGVLSDRLGRRRLVAVSMFLASVLLAAFVQLDGVFRAVLLVPMGLVGLSVAPALMAAIQDAFPADRGLANGVYQAVNFVVRSVVVVGVGALADRWGIRAAFLVCAAVPVVALPLVGRLPGRGEGPASPGPPGSSDGGPPS